MASIHFSLLFYLKKKGGGTREEGGEGQAFGRLASFRKEKNSPPLQPANNSSSSPFLCPQAMVKLTACRWWLLVVWAAAVAPPVCCCIHGPLLLPVASCLAPNCCCCLLADCWPAAANIRYGVPWEEKAMRQRAESEWPAGWLTASTSGRSTSLLRPPSSSLWPSPHSLSLTAVFPFVHPAAGKKTANRANQQPAGSKFPRQTHAKRRLAAAAGIGGILEEAK